MICGEHAVALGISPAIVCAVEARIHIKVSKRADDIIHIQSDLGYWQTNCRNMQFPQDKALRFVKAAFLALPPPCGVDMQIESAINATLGLGSSAAVLIALVKSLTLLQGKDTLHEADIHRLAYQILTQVQGIGSGADLAASLRGGMIAYHPYPRYVITGLNIPAQAQLLSIYAGYKLPTVEALHYLRERERKEDLSPHYFAMADICQKAILANQKQDWQTFYRLLNAYQERMQAIGMCDEIERTHTQIGQQEGFASKISGSGRGDCVIVFAPSLTPALAKLGAQCITQALQGLIVHEEGENG